MLSGVVPALSLNGGYVMKVVFGGGVADARGSIAGNTFSRNKGGAYSRQRVTGINPNTPLQNEVRTILSQLATEWSSLLTQTQRDGWGTFAQNFPITNNLGAVIYLTGQQAYQRINQRLLNAGLSKIATAPTDQDVTDLTSASLAADVNGDALDLTFAPSPIAAGDYIVVRMSPQVSPGKIQAKNQLRTVLISGSAATTPLDLAAAWSAYYGESLVEGRKIFFEVFSIRSSNGAIDTPLVGSTVVVDTTV